MRFRKRTFKHTRSVTVSTEKKTPVHIVAQEQKIGLRRVTRNFKEFQQVVKLPVNVAADSDGAPDRRQVGLSLENFFRQITQSGYLCFRQGLAALETLNPAVEVGCGGGCTTTTTTTTVFAAIVVFAAVVAAATFTATFAATVLPHLLHRLHHSIPGILSPI